jgi:hypothetical protein
MTLIDKNILICGLCRDIEPYFEEVSKNINLIGSAFKKFDTLFLENDSVDNTKKLLNSKHYNVLFHDGLKYKYPQRTARIAFCRNTILKTILEEEKYKSVDYILWMDMDDVCSSKIDLKSIESINFNCDWGMMCAFKQTGYYDIWALRHPQYSPDDCIHNLIRDGWHNQWAHEKHVHSRMRKMNELQKIDKLIEVDSAFGGMAFVNKKYLSNTIVFNGLDIYGREQCEWVSFCHGLKQNGGTIYVNSEFLI